MAKIVCEYDSNTKEFTVSIDGKVLDNVDNYSCCSGGDYSNPYCSISQCIHDKEHDVRTQMYTMANHSPDGKVAIEEGGKVDFLASGMVTFKGEKTISKEISKYFLRK